MECRSDGVLEEESSTPQLQYSITPLRNWPANYAKGRESAHEFRLRVFRVFGGQSFRSGRAPNRFGPRPASAMAKCCPSYRLGQTPWLMSLASQVNAVLDEDRLNKCRSSACRDQQPASLGRCALDFGVGFKNNRGDAVGEQRRREPGRWRLQDAFGLSPARRG